MQFEAWPLLVVPRHLGELAWLHEQEFEAQAKQQAQVLMNRRDLSQALGLHVEKKNKMSDN
jgi:hypothetical protein